MWKQKEIYVGPYFFRSWEILEALEKIKHSSSEVRMIQSGRLHPTQRLCLLGSQVVVSKSQVACFLYKPLPKLFLYNVSSLIKEHRPGKNPGLTKNKRY